MGINSAILRVIGKTSIARFVALLGSLFLLVIVGKSYGAESLGHFAMGQSAMLFIAIVARFGMNNSLIKFVGADPSSFRVKEYFKTAMVQSFFSSVGLVLLFFLFIFMFGENFWVGYNLKVITIMVLSSIPFTLLFIISGFMKGLGFPAKASLIENGGGSLIAASVVFLFKENLPGVEDVALVFFLSILIILIYSLSWSAIHIKKKINPDTIGGTFDKKEFRNTSKSFFALSVVQLVQQSGFILVIGLFLQADDLGVLKAAERAAFLVGFSMMIVNAVFPPKFSNAHANKDFAKIKNLGKMSASIGFIMAMPLFLACVFFAKDIMAVFGDGFSSGANFLIIIAFAQLINSSCGAAGFILTMTGNEIHAKRVAVASSFIGLIGIAIGANFLSGLGAASGLSVMIIGQNLACVFVIKKKLGFWLLPSFQFKTS